MGRRSALHLAAAEGQADAVVFLLNHGANPSARDRFGNRPLEDARRGNHIRSAHFLKAAMQHDTLKGKARSLYTQLLSRNTGHFMPSWGDMVNSTLHWGATVAFDTENHAKGQIIEYDPAFLSVFGWCTKFRGE